MAALDVNVDGLEETANALESFGTGATDKVVWVVSVGAKYGSYVEFGTSKMKAQPFLFPAARTVMRQDFPRLETRALQSSDPMEAIVRLVAVAIEGKAKRYAPVDTGFLRSSIQAAPAFVF